MHATVEESFEDNSINVHIKFTREELEDSKSFFETLVGGVRKAIEGSSLVNKVRKYKDYQRVLLCKEVENEER